MRQQEPVLIYGGSAATYLLVHMFPAARRIPAYVGEAADDVLSRLDACPEWFIFHVNLTFTERCPADRERLTAGLAAAGTRMLNAGVTDISKANVQQGCREAGLNSTLAELEGDPDELLIIKTNCNCGGVGEKLLPPEQRERLDLPYAPAEYWHREYRVLPRAQVPPELWSFQDLVIERYVNNAQQIFFRAYVCRNHLIVSRVVDEKPLKRMPEGIPREDFLFRVNGSPEIVEADASDPPEGLAEEVVRFCRSFRLDFGALDIVQDDEGRYYIVDVNTTPVWGNTGHPDLIGFLASGIEEAG